MPKTALVTGGAGFIGSHLVDLLLDKGFRVRVVDNFSTGRPENLAHRAKDPALTLIQADIGEARALKGVFDGADHVYHLAALADIVPSIQAPGEYFRSNVDGTFNVLEAARQAGVGRFLYTASSSCYGVPDLYPTPESAEMRPQYPYALTKMLGEQLAMHWRQVYKLPLVSLRLFNVFGPRSRTSGTYGAVFGVFLAQKLAGRPLTIVGDGTQTRDFTYVTDVARAMFMAVNSELSGQIMNVGSGGHYSVNRLAGLLGGETVAVPKRPGEPECTFADTTRIGRLLGWRPEVSFEQGVAEVLRNIDYWKEAPVWTPETIAEATRDWFKYLS
ncbi:MAG: SDR family oxidoreductase [Desulfovibrionaceae bacterium]|nr:SDR family oxidoreductase [Desulfovibrionaceae bacterium]